MNFTPFCLRLGSIVLTISTCRADFQLKDGDKVVFLGDSITAAHRYDRIVENYTLLRFPERRVQFFNAGKGGDTATGALTRLEREVFARHATVLIVAFGVNDIGWGMKADAEHKQQYLTGIRKIVEAGQQHGVRVFICSAAITNQEPDKAETGFLQSMCDEGLNLAKSLGAGAIEIQRPMREVQRRLIAVNAAQKDPKKPVLLHVADGVHLNEPGHMAMALAILKGLGAPAEVSAATIDAKGPQLVTASGCTISGVKNESGLEFDRLDEGWPINFGALGALNFVYVPYPDQLGRYLLTVTHLDAGAYEVLAGGRLLGHYSEKQLAAGVNLAFATANGWEPGGPWDAQSAELAMVTNARFEIAGSESYAAHFSHAHPQHDALRADSNQILAQLESLQRKVAHPFPVHFLLRPVGKDRGLPAR
jgi:lysophospholipase L1-like esterase